MDEFNIIKWTSERLLKWSDFKADANPAEFEDAHSTIKYRPKWTVGSIQFDSDEDTPSTNEQNPDNGFITHDKGTTSEDVPHKENKEIFFVIECLSVETEFWPCLSWARLGCDDAALSHQQGHFDLGEFLIRKEIHNIRNSLYNKRFPTRGKNEEQRKQFAKNDSAIIIEPVIRKLNITLEKMNLDYDIETEHGCNITAQSKYHDMFASLRQ